MIFKIKILFTHCGFCENKQTYKNRQLKWKFCALKKSVNGLNG